MGTSDGSKYFATDYNKYQYVLSLGVENLIELGYISKIGVINRQHPAPVIRGILDNENYQESFAGKPIGNLHGRFSSTERDRKWMPPTDVGIALRELHDGGGYLSQQELEKWYKSVIKFAFPKETIDAFSHGDCWLLALSLRNLFGSKATLVTISPTERKGADAWAHVGVKIKNSIVDITGIYSEEEWLTINAHWYDPTIWEVYIRSWTDAEFAQDILDNNTVANYLDQDVEAVAKQLATKLILTNLLS